LTEDTGPLEVYVWFEADPAHDESVRRSFARLVGQMASAAPVGRAAAGPPRLLRRTDLRIRPEGLRVTWMEVWTGIPAGGLPQWLAAMDAALAGHGAAASPAGARHVEVFAPDADG